MDISRTCQKLNPDPMTIQHTNPLSSASLPHFLNHIICLNIFRASFEEQQA
jgi:hypothetical protein